MMSSSFGSAWDRYIETFERKREDFSKAAGRDITLPGDEWGHPAGWRKRAEVLFRDRLLPGPQLAFEIGPGSGKYTKLFLDRFPGSKVIACDVSEKYLTVLCEQCATEVEKEIIVPELLSHEPTNIEEIANTHGVHGKIDCVFSIDAMVHVGLQWQAAYWLAARNILRPGGVMIIGVADVLTDEGYSKLIRDIPTYFRRQGAGAFGQFEWMSRDIVQGVLTRMGFDIEFIDEASSRDCYFAATSRLPQVQVSGPAV